MQKYFYVILVTAFLYGCGGEEAVEPSVLSLDSIGNKTATVGGPDVDFTVTAFDPDSLSYSFDSTGRVGSNPYDFGATFNTNTGAFNWNITNATAGSYFVTFTVTNTNLDTDSEEIQITIQAQPGQFQTGESLYNAQCQSCHGTGGKGGEQTIIECIDSATFFATINSGSMAQYATSWGQTDKEAVLFYLNNIDPSRC